MNLFNFLGMLDNYEERTVDRTDIDDGVVSTAAVTDSAKPFETGIGHPLYNNGHYIIVECYNTKEEAAEGHKKWCAFLEQKPPSLEDRSESSIALLLQDLDPNRTRVYPRKDFCD